MDIRYMKIRKTDQQIINSKLQVFYDRLIEAFAPYQKYTMDRNEENWKERATFCSEKYNVVHNIIRSITDGGRIPVYDKNRKSLITKRIWYLRDNLLVIREMAVNKNCSFYTISDGIYDFSKEYDSGAGCNIGKYYFRNDVNFTAMHYEEDTLKIFDILFTDLHEQLDWIDMELKSCEEEYDRHKLGKFFREAGGIFHYVFYNISTCTIIKMCYLVLIIFMFGLVAFYCCAKEPKSPTEETVKSEQNINTSYQEHAENTTDEKTDSLNGVSADAAHEDEIQDTAEPEQKEQAETKNEKADSTTVSGSELIFLILTFVAVILIIILFIVLFVITAVQMIKEFNAY